jgi:hypothetical protein
LRNARANLNTRVIASLVAGRVGGVHRIVVDEGVAVESLWVAWFGYNAVGLYPVVKIRRMTYSERR